MSPGSEPEPIRLIEYTAHALVRMDERRVKPHDVAIVLAEPDELSYGHDGELIASKRMGKRTILVVFDESASLRRVITVMTN